MDRTQWRRLAGACTKGEECEGIFLTELGRVAIQGEHLVGATTPRGEAIVEVSPDLLREAARVLG